MSALALAVLSPAAVAFAGNGVTEDELKRPSDVDPQVAAGELLPFTVGARHERQGILLGAYGGFDVAKRAPLMEGRLDATLIEKVTLRALMTNVGMSDQLQPSVGLLVDVLREDTSGIDFAVGGDYENASWSARMPAVVTRAALGSTVGLTRIQANAAFGLTTERGERYGDLRLSGFHPVARQLYAGIDSRARVDLERSGEEPSGELDWDVQAGPVASLAVGRFAVSATGGVSAWKARASESAKVGAVAAVGLGAAF
jgi:hypothetical protein